MDIKSIAKKPKGYYEWMALWFITGNIPGYSLFIYNLSNNSPANNYLLYISVISLLVNLIAWAKCGIFNVFRENRKLFKVIKYEIWWMWYDYKHWKQFGKRAQRMH